MLLLINYSHISRKTDTQTWQTALTNNIHKVYNKMTPNLTLLIQNRSGANPAAHLPSGISAATEERREGTGSDTTRELHK